MEFVIRYMKELLKDSNLCRQDRCALGFYLRRPDLLEKLGMQKVLFETRPSGVNTLEFLDYLDFDLWLERIGYDLGYGGI